MRACMRACGYGYVCVRVCVFAGAGACVRANMSVRRCKDRYMHTIVIQTNTSPYLKYDLIITVIILKS